VDLSTSGATACLLHNEPASYFCVARLSTLRYVAVAKASPKWANQLHRVDPKRDDLAMARMKVR
jgi:hypothetical protein